MIKSNMEITVGFLAGTSIEDACIEAKTFAVNNNIAIVRFDFNGGRLWDYPASRY